MLAPSTQLLALVLSACVVSLNGKGYLSRISMPTCRPWTPFLPSIHPLPPVNRFQRGISSMAHTRDLALKSPLLGDTFSTREVRVAHSQGFRLSMLLRREGRAAVSGAPHPAQL